MRASLMIEPSPFFTSSEAASLPSQKQKYRGGQLTLLEIEMQRRPAYPPRNRNAEVASLPSQKQKCREAASLPSQKQKQRRPAYPPRNRNRGGQLTLLEIEMQRRLAYPPRNRNAEIIIYNLKNVQEIFPLYTLLSQISYQAKKIISPFAFYNYFCANLLQTFYTKHI